MLLDPLIVHLDSQSSRREAVEHIRGFFPGERRVRFAGAYEVLACLRRESRICCAAPQVPALDVTEQDWGFGVWILQLQVERCVTTRCRWRGRKNNRR